MECRECYFTRPLVDGVCSDCRPDDQMDTATREAIDDAWKIIRRFDRLDRLHVTVIRGVGALWRQVCRSEQNRLARVLRAGYWRRGGER